MMIKNRMMASYGGWDGGSESNDGSEFDKLINLMMANTGMMVLYWMMPMNGSFVAN